MENQYTLDWYLGAFNGWKKISSIRSLKKGVIYCVRNDITDYFYIGQSKQLYVRLDQHMNNPSSPLYHDFRKYGPENFSFTIIERCENRKLKEREFSWIECFDKIGKSLYNSGYGRKNGHTWFKRNHPDEYTEIKRLEQELTLKKAGIYMAVLPKPRTKSEIRRIEGIYLNKMRKVIESVA